MKNLKWFLVGLSILGLWSAGWAGPNVENGKSKEDEKIISIHSKNDANGKSMKSEKYFVTRAYLFKTTWLTLELKETTPSRPYFPPPIRIAVADEGESEIVKLILETPALEFHVDYQSMTSGSMVTDQERETGVKIHNDTGSNFFYYKVSPENVWVKLRGSSLAPISLATWMQAQK